MLDVQVVNVDLRVADVHLDVPIFVEVLLGNDAEVVVAIFAVVLLLDEIDVVNGLDVVGFSNSS